MIPFSSCRRSLVPAVLGATLAAIIGAGCGSATATPTPAGFSPSSSAAPTATLSPTPALSTPSATATPTAVPTPTPSPTASQSPVYLTNGLAASLQKTVSSYQAAKALPGLSVAVDFPDGRLWAGQSGISILSSRTPLTADTLFSIGSVSKTFVAALVLRLAEQGKLSLDDPLSRYVPSFYLASKITVRMMLNHTSGIMDLFGAVGMGAAILATPTRTWTTDQVLAKIGRQRYAFAPGKGYHYSNTDFVLLGVVVAKVTGQSVSSLVRSEFLQPLGMASTYLQTEETAGQVGIANPRAHGYCPGPTGCSTSAALASKPRDNSAGTMLPFTSEATAVGVAGAYVSTPSDLALWAAALYGGRILKPASLAAMTDTSQTAIFHPKWVYGLGFEKTIIDGQVAWGHRGNLDGFWSAMEYLPAYGVTIVITANGNWCDPLAATAAVAQVILPPAPTPAPSTK